MRLEKIKLSGFKTFVEPTTIPLPVNLVGIVGPNGCGKSNIIDAVRWVMGESSAKNLRGGSMSDVIFNGSTSRKPISKASVELIFDNDDGTIGGEYAKYSQLSIKRQVIRDGQSSYFLNGSKCRRRDITGIFLGTGLGPRSYAIIEQGMISRLIEAKPEDLRVFLEEAAGVSKYKERRHETEIRMRHTRENLERLTDLREELSKQIGRLKQQAKIAERYKKLRSEERRYKRELLALRWQKFDQQFQVLELEILNQQSALQKTTAGLQQLDSQTEETRKLYSDCQTHVNIIQANFYELGSDIARIEQDIRHTQSLQKQAEVELSRASEEKSDCLSLLDKEKNHLVELLEQRGKLEVEQVEVESKEKLAITHQKEIAERNHAWQFRWEQFINQASEPKEQLKTHQARLRFLEQQQQQLLKRKKRLDEELLELNEKQTSHEVLESFQAEIDQFDEQNNRMQLQLEKLGHEIIESRDLNQRLNQDTNQIRTELQSVKGKIVALEQIMEHATGRDRDELVSWLKEQGLEDAPRLIEQIEVENGWEAAVEMVLSEFIEAVCIDSCKPVLSHLQALSKESVSLIDKGASFSKISDNPRLISKVNSPWSLNALLGTIYCADDLDSAYKQVGKLKSHESIISIDGIWMGPGWLLKAGQKGVKSGLLQKEKELKQLRNEEAELVGASAEHSQALKENLSRLKEIENRQGTLRSKQGQTADLLSTKKSRLATLVSGTEQNSQRRGKLQQELKEIEREESRFFKEQQESLALIKASELKTASFERKKEQLRSDRDKLKIELEKANQQAKELRDRLHKLSSRLTSIDSNEHFCVENLERTEALLGQVEKRIDEIKQPDAETEQLITKQESVHQEKMQQKMELDETLKKARRELSIIENNIRENSEKRAHLESEISHKRDALEKSRVSQEGLIVHRDTVVQQLSEQGVELQDLLETMHQEANEEEWQMQIEQLSKKIERLGTINLAAIEEHGAVSERMKYLDEQDQDLNESLSMLEQAISKIDRETKALFKETFEKVNNGFQQRFPKLFGGGRAYLSLDDQDLLSTGVSVMASPPGKRNSSIHLLSGGEKALTAVALVFSIFDLNPAPFCLLDEVDAPLDDANVTRFSELVKEMSSSVQFLFISHNKSTMEIAQHLAGVTMSEPGISRMVSVDIEEAVKLAEL
jgi:chromosome segregation protein